MRVTIEKKTDQLNYEDFLGGTTRIVTIAGVKAGTKEQQYDIALEGDKRVWRPAVTVLKLLVAAWGDDATEWVGRRAMLYGDPTVRFGSAAVGGIRVSHVSHITKPVEANLTETRGKRKGHTVEPLPDTPTAPTEADVQASTDTDLLRSWWTAHPHLQDAIKTRVDELKASDEVQA
jgi:hypothetical protein